MNFIKSIATVIICSSLLFACQKNNTETKKLKTTKEASKKDLAVVLKKTEFHIKGMTCEIGCARLIQSKLAKVDGVNFVKVSFKDSLGMIEFDTNKLSNSKIKTIVNGIAGGDLYKITDSKEVIEFSVK